MTNWKEPTERGLAKMEEAKKCLDADEKKTEKS
jgi:hypothetical protein